MVDYSHLASMTAQGARAFLGDSNFGGNDEKPDAVMAALWQVAVAETRELLTGPWRNEAANGKNPVSV